MSLLNEIGSTNPELLRLLADMSRTDAWAEFMDRYGPMVHQICNRWRLSFHEREEIRSRVLIRVVETFLSRESRIRSSFRGYLFRIITNEILALLRSKKKDSRIVIVHARELEQLSTVSVLPAEEIEAIESDILERLSWLQAVFDAVKRRTSNDTWNIFWAITVKGMSASDAAGLFGTTRITAWKANDRVLQMIRDEVARRGNG